jgi:hypothetical protein
METINIPVFLRRIQPKGGMCATCAKLGNDCSDLDFAQMPTIESSDKVIIVKCTEHVRSNVELTGSALLRSPG